VARSHHVAVRPAQHPRLARLTLEMRIIETAGDEGLLRFRQRSCVPVVRPALGVLLMAVAAAVRAGACVARGQRIARLIRRAFLQCRARSGLRRLAMTRREQQQRRNAEDQSWTRKESWQSLHVSLTTLNCSSNAFASPCFASAASFALSRSSFAATRLNSGSCCQIAGLASVRI